VRRGIPRFRGGFGREVESPVRSSDEFIEFRHEISDRASRWPRSESIEATTMIDIE